MLITCANRSTGRLASNELAEVGDDELSHAEHRVPRPRANRVVGVLEERVEHPRNDLSADAETILAPSAHAFFATVGAQ